MNEVNHEAIKSEFLQALEAQDPNADDIKSKSELRDAQIFLRNFTRSSEELKEDLKGSNQDKTAKERELRDLRREPTRIQSELESQQGKITTTQTDLDKAKGDLGKLPEDADATNRTELEKKIKELEAQLEAQKAEETKLKEDLATAEAKVEETEKAIGDLEKEIAAVTQSLESIEAHAYNKDTGLWMARSTAEENALKDRQAAYEKALKSVAASHSISVADVRDIIDGPVEVPEKHQKTVEEMRPLGFSRREAVALIEQVDRLKEKGEGLELDFETLLTDTNAFIDQHLKLPENSDMSAAELEIIRENLRKYVGQRIQAIPSVIKGMESDFGDDWQNRKWEINRRLQESLSDIEDVMTASNNIVRMSDPAEKKAFMESEFVKSLLAQSEEKMRTGAVHEDQTWAWQMKNFMADARTGLTSPDFDPTNVLGQDWTYSNREGENLSAGVGFLNNEFFSVPASEIDNVFFAGNGSIGKRMVVEIDGEKIHVGDAEHEMELIQSGKLPEDWRSKGLELARASSDPGAEVPYINFLSREDQETEAKVWKAYLAAIGFQVIPYAGAASGLVADIGDLNPFSDAETTMAVLRATRAVPENYRLDKTTADYFLGGAGVVLTAFGIQAATKGLKVGRRMPRALRAIARLEESVPVVADAARAEAVPNAGKIEDAAPVTAARAEVPPVEAAATLRKDVADLSSAEVADVSELENVIRLRSQDGLSGRKADLLDQQIESRMRNLREKGIDVDAVLEARRANVAPMAENNVVEFPVAQTEVIPDEVALPRAVGDGITPVHRADPPPRMETPPPRDNVVNINTGKPDGLDDQIASLQRIEEAELRAKREAELRLFQNAEADSMADYNRFLEKQNADRIAAERKAFTEADAESMARYEEFIEQQAAARRAEQMKLVRQADAESMAAYNKLLEEQAAARRTHESQAFKTANAESMTAYRKLLEEKAAARRAADAKRLEQLKASRTANAESMADYHKLLEQEAAARRVEQLRMMQKADAESMMAYRKLLEEQAAARRAADAKRLEQLKASRTADAKSMQALEAANDNQRIENPLISTAGTKEARHLDTASDSRLIETARAQEAQRLEAANDNFRIPDLRRSDGGEVPPVVKAGIHPIHAFEAGRIATNIPPLAEALVVSDEIQARIDAAPDPETKLAVLTENLTGEIIRGKRAEILEIFEKYPDRESAFREWHKINAEIAKLYGIEGLEMGEAAYAEGSESLRFGTKIQEIFRADLEASGIELTSQQMALLSDGKFGFESMQVAKLSLARLEQTDVSSPEFAEAVTKLATEATTSSAMVEGIALQLGIKNIPAGPVGDAIRTKIAKQIQLSTGIEPADGVLGPNSRETLKSVDWKKIDLTATINKPPLTITPAIRSELATFTTDFSEKRLNSLDTATALGKIFGIEARTPIQVRAINEAYQTALNQGLPDGEKIPVDGTIGPKTQGAAAKVDMNSIDWSAFNTLST